MTIGENILSSYNAIQVASARNKSLELEEERLEMQKNRYAQLEESDQFDIDTKNAQKAMVTVQQSGLDYKVNNSGIPEWIPESIDFNNEEHRLSMAGFLGNLTGDNFTGLMKNDIKDDSGNIIGSTYTPLLQREDGQTVPMTEDRSSDGKSNVIQLTEQQVRNQMNKALTNRYAIGGGDNIVDKYQSGMKIEDINDRLENERKTEVEQRAAQEILTATPVLQRAELANILADMSGSELREAAAEYNVDLSGLEDQVTANQPSAYEIMAETYNANIDEYEAAIERSGEAPMPATLSTFEAFRRHLQNEQIGLAKNGQPWVYNNMVHPAARRQWELRRTIDSNAVAGNWFSTVSQGRRGFPLAVSPTNLGQAQDDVRDLTNQITALTSKQEEAYESGNDEEVQRINEEIVPLQTELNQATNYANAVGAGTMQKVDMSRFSEGGGQSDISLPFLQHLKFNQDKEFVRRVLDPASNDLLERQYGVDENETHRMAAEFRDGKWVVFPTVVNQDGLLVRLEQSETSDEAYDYAKANNEFIDFGPDGASARAFAEDGYKTLDFRTHFAGQPDAQPEMTDEQMREAILNQVQTPEQTAQAAETLRQNNVTSPEDFRKLPPREARNTAWLIAANHQGSTTEQLQILNDLMNYITTGSQEVNPLQVDQESRMGDQLTLDQNKYWDGREKDWIAAEMDAQLNVLQDVKKVHESYTAEFNNLRDPDNFTELVSELQEAERIATIKTLQRIANGRVPARARIAQEELTEIYAMAIVAEGKRNSKDNMFEGGWKIIGGRPASSMPIQDIADNLVINKDGNKIGLRRDAGGTSIIWFGEAALSNVADQLGNDVAKAFRDQLLADDTKIVEF